MTKPFIVVISLILLAATAFAGQGVQRMLYTAPNTAFIEQPAGESVVTVNDASGSVEALQTAINNARSANPDKIIVIRLKRGATYIVSGAGITLDSRQCLVAEGAIIRAANSSVTAPLITIASGATRVSVAGGALDGLGANIIGIYAPAASRVNIDLVVVRNCGLDCIQLHGNGNSTYDNEMTVTRSDSDRRRTATCRPVGRAASIPCSRRIPSACSGCYQPARPSTPRWDVPGSHH